MRPHWFPGLCLALINLGFAGLFFAVGGVWGPVLHLVLALLAGAAALLMWRARRAASPAEPPSKV